MKRHLTNISLATAILFFSFSGVQTAEAKIRVRANIRLPHVGIRIDTRSADQRRVVVRRAPLPVRHHAHYELTKQDRKMAKRLAKYTDASKGELLDMRRQGYSWLDIGYWQDLPRSTVRAARDSASWQRFLKMERRHARGHRNWDRRYDHVPVCYRD